MSSLQSQGAISSLVYSSSALTTAASLGYVFGKPSKSTSSSLSSSLSSLSKKKNHVNIIINDNNSPVKKRFNLFRLKSNKHHRHRHNHCDSDDYTHNNHKIISDDVAFDKMIAEPEAFIVNYFQTPPSTPPTNITYHNHHHHYRYHHNNHPPLMVLPDQLTTDDDVSSLCSDATSFYLSDRSKSCSVTTFATLSNTNINNINTNSNINTNNNNINTNNNNINNNCNNSSNNNNNNNNHSLIWDENNSNSNNLRSVSMTNVAVPNGHNLAETLLEEDEEENWNDNSSIEEDNTNIHSNNNLNGDDDDDDILIDSSSPSTSKKKKRTSLPPPEHIRSSTPLKNHHRCKSLPPVPLSELSPSFYRQPTPSESWDNDFVLDDLELNVPNSVKDAQISLKMDIYTIKDFVSQIEELKTLYDDKLTLSCTIKSKMKRRRWSSGFLSNSAKKYNTLESMFKEHWEEAAVIIDLSEIAQDREQMFGGGERVEVDIENIPSKRHLKVLKRIIEKEMANNNHSNCSNTNNLDYYDDSDDDRDENDDKKGDDDHKENHYKKPKLMFNNNRTKRFSLSSSSSSSSSSSTSSISPKTTTKTTKSKRNKKKKEEKYKDFRISVEVMPSLVEHLRKLQEHLTEHVNELKVIAKQ